MSASPPTDQELATVARVAGREGWDDLSAPPEAHPPRTLEEELAVARFAEALPRRRPAGARARRIRARLAVAALSAVVLGGCWVVSPTRTAIGLLGAGVFSMVALHRSRRRAPRAPGAARRPGLLGGLGLR